MIESYLHTLCYWSNLFAFFFFSTFRFPFRAYHIHEVVRTSLYLLSSFFSCEYLSQSMCCNFMWQWVFFTNPPAIVPLILSFQSFFWPSRCTTLGHGISSDHWTYHYCIFLKTWGKGQLMSSLIFFSTVNETNSHAWLPKRITHGLLLSN